jgi:hypothetical protein
MRNQRVCCSSCGVRRHPFRAGFAYQRAHGSPEVQRPAGSRHRRRAERFGVGCVVQRGRHSGRGNCARQTLNWVGLTSEAASSGALSKMLYSTATWAQPGSAVSLPCRICSVVFPRRFQDRTAYRAIRPAGAAWLQSRIAGVPITLGRKVVPRLSRAASFVFDLTTGPSASSIMHSSRPDSASTFRRYPFLSQSLLRQLEKSTAFPVLNRGLESSIPGLHFLGKPAAGASGRCSVLSRERSSPRTN